MQYISFTIQLTLALALVFTSGCYTDEGAAPGSELTDGSTTTTPVESPVVEPPVVEAPVVTPPAPFAPTDIPDIHSWFDASDSSLMTLDGSNKVSAWRDKYNAGVSMVQATASSQPVLEANAINGKSAVKFDGSNDDMRAVINTAIGSNTTLVLVVKINSSTGSIPFCFNTTTYNYGPNIYSADGTVNWNTGDNAYNKFVGSTYPASSAVHIYTIKNDQVTNRAEFYLDGIYVGFAAHRNTAITNFSVPRLIIGNWVNAGQYTFGHFAELIIFNKVISELERTELEDHLKTKWGVL